MAQRSYDNHSKLRFDQITIIRDPFVYCPFLGEEGIKISIPLGAKIPEGIAPEVWYRPLTPADLADYMGQLDQENLRLSQQGAPYKRVKLFGAIYENHQMPDTPSQKRYKENGSSFSPNNREPHTYQRLLEIEARRHKPDFYRERFEAEYGYKIDGKGLTRKYREGRLEVKDMFNVSEITLEDGSTGYSATPTLEHLHKYLEWTKNLDDQRSVCSQLRTIFKNDGKESKGKYLDHDNLPFPYFVYNTPQSVFSPRSLLS